VSISLFSDLHLFFTKWLVRCYSQKSFIQSIVHRAEPAWQYKNHQNTVKR